MNRYTFVLPSENQNAFPLLSICANAVCNVIQSLKDISSRNFEIRRRVLRVEKKWWNSKRTHLSLSLSLSLLDDLSMHFDFPERICMYQPLSLAIYICKNGLDPDQIRKEFRKECFVKLKICACDRKYAKCRTKADAHEKMGFQYISISVDIVRSHARIQRGDRGSGPPPPPENHKNNEFLSNTGPDPLKLSNLPSQHSTLGHHRHASEMPFKGVSPAGRWCPLLVIFGSSLP